MWFTRGLTHGFAIPDMTEQTLVNPTIPAIELRTKAPQSASRQALRRFTQHRLAMVGIALILLMVIATFFGSANGALVPDLKVMNKPPRRSISLAQTAWGATSWRAPY